MTLRIGLHFIVKNEADRIEACLKDNLELADYFSIAVDSGSSSDTTYEICRKIVGPNSVFRDEWKDSFSDSRNAALNHLLIQHPDVDYIYWIDSDDLWSTNSISPAEVRKRLEEQQPFSVKNLYAYGEYTPTNPGLVYHRNRIWKCLRAPDGKPLSTRYWVGPAHEVNVFYPEYQQSEILWDDWVLTHLKNNNEDHRGGRTQRNIKAFKKSLKTEPNHPRYLFYLAREYKDAREWDSSLEYYKKYIEVSFFPEEKYQALLDMATIYRVKEDIDNAMRYAKEAWTFKPEIAEAAVLIGELYTLKNDWKASKPWFSYAVHAPHGNVLFDNVASRTIIPHRWLSVASFYTDDIDQGSYSHSKAREINPLDPLVRKNESWLFDNKYPCVDRQILDKINMAEDFVNLSENISDFYFSGMLSKFSRVRDCENFFMYGQDLSIYYTDDYEVGLVDNIELINENLLIKMLNFTKSYEIVFPIRVLFLNNEKYDFNLLGLLIKNVVSGGFIVINNFDDNNIKNLLSDLLLNHNNLNVAKVIELLNNKLVILAKSLE